MIDDSDFIFAQSLREKKCFCWCHTNTLGTILRRFPQQEQKRKEIVMAEPSSDNQVRFQNQVDALSKINIEYFPGGKIPCHGGLL